ncbi:MAG: GrpB family protein [Actinomycetota bacterium]
MSAPPDPRVPGGQPLERGGTAFRDALRADPGLAGAYERLKRELAEAHPRDVQTYNRRKTPFVREVETRVLASG